MCEFVSWLVTLDKKVHFLMDADMPRVKELGISAEDARGHGAIRAMRGWTADNTPQATEKECADFSSPANFPPEIVAAIKAGRMIYGPPQEALLTTPAQAEYQRITGQAWAEYQRITGQAWAEYQRIKGQACWALFADPKNRAKAWR